jgi:hypothetical protein
MHRFDSLFSWSKLQKISNMTVFTLFYGVIYCVAIFGTSLTDISRYMWTFVACVTIGLILNIKIIVYKNTTCLNYGKLLRGVMLS